MGFLGNQEKKLPLTMNNLLKKFHHFVPNIHRDISVEKVLRHIFQYWITVITFKWLSILLRTLKHFESK